MVSPEKPNPERFIFSNCNRFVRCLRFVSQHLWQMFYFLHFVYCGGRVFLGHYMEEEMEDVEVVGLARG